MITVNPRKTLTIVFTQTKKKYFQLKDSFWQQFNLIAIKDLVKYLGTTLDNKLNLSFHLKILEAKISKALGVLTKLQHILPKKKKLQRIYTTPLYIHTCYMVSLSGEVLYLKKPMI